MRCFGGEPTEHQASDTDARRKLRVLLVVGTFGVGGTETQLCRLARELQLRGHIVKVVALFKGGPMASVLRSSGVPFEIVGWGGFVYRDPEQGLMLRDLARSIIVIARFWLRLWKFRPDVCHAFLPWAYMVTMPGAALGGVPVRVAGRRSLSSRLNLRRRERLLQRISVAASHVVIANSAAVAEDARVTEGLSPARLRVILNGVDLPDKPSDVLRSPPAGLVVANLIAYKGHEDLIQAIAQLPDPPVIRLVGQGPERPILIALVALMRLEKVVLFEGRILPAGRIFAESQFSVLPSHEEGLPNVVLEAMSYGLPVIATTVGGIPELIEHEVTGLLIPPHDPAALALAIERLSGDPELRVLLGSAARRAAEKFSWMRCVEAHEDLYFGLLRGRSNVARISHRAASALAQAVSSVALEPSSFRQAL